MRLLQILLAQSEGGAETFFEKIAMTCEKDESIDQLLIIEAHEKRKNRLIKGGCKVVTLGVDWLSKKLNYNAKLQWHARRFKPDITLAWMSRSARKAPVIKDAIKVARIGGYYPIKHYRTCDYLIVNTPELIDFMVKQGWDPQRIAMISNFGEIPKDTQHASDPREIVPAGNKVLLTLGRLHRNKAQDILIKAMPHMPNTHLLIAGEGELEAELKHLAEELGVTDRVHFLGWRRDTKFLFDQSDICVFPSREEALGNVVLEAWATKTPIVAAKSAGPDWLIDHDTNGLLSPIDDHLDFATQVNRLIDTPELGDRLVEAGYEKFQSEFTKAVIMGHYKAFFQELLEAKQSNRPADLTRWR